jgi:hypothetical protein
MEDTIDQDWRKSSYSGNGGGNCVEVANASPVVLVRDTKNRDGGVLSIPADAWARFTAGLKLQRQGTRPRWDVPCRGRCCRGNSVHTDQRLI